MWSWCQWGWDVTLNQWKVKKQSCFFLTWKYNCVSVRNSRTKMCYVIVSFKWSACADLQCMCSSGGSDCDISIESLKELGCLVSWNPFQRDWHPLVLLYLTHRWGIKKKDIIALLYISTEDNAVILAEASLFWQLFLFILYYHSSSMSLALIIGHLLHSHQQHYLA